MNLDIITEEQLSALQNIISNTHKALVIGHKSPDGDAVGSTLAWAAVLRQHGIEATVAYPDMAPDFLQWLPDFQTTLRYDKKPDAVAKAAQEADTIFCLDFNTLQRMETEGMIDAVAQSGARRVMIDHHTDPQTEPFALVISHPEMSSTCEVVYRIMRQMGYTDTMTRQAAICIYAGMMTDTGGFTYNSCRPEIFAIIAELLGKGIDKDMIYNRVFHNYSPWAVRFRGYVMSQKLKVVEGLHASYYLVTRKEMKKFHFVKGDLEGVVNIPLTIRKHKLSIALREDTERDNVVYVSMRSSCGFHCVGMAQQFFNGGGHEDASGGKLFCSIEEAEQTALRAIMAYREELK